MKEFLRCYVVVFRDAETGEERTSAPYEGVYDDEFPLYWWTDGNMGCGCNRQAEWHRAAPNHNEDEWVEGDDARPVHPILGPLFGDCWSERFQARYAITAKGQVFNIDG